MIKPFGLKAVSDLAIGCGLPICGIGGIRKWEDVVEYMLLGASVVQVCTGVMWEGFG
jgi:dihydropyrimidine dehydrogenase (NAD+) subunit PreA